MGGEIAVPETTTQTNVNVDNSNNTGTIYRTPTGKRYHYDVQCGGKNSYEVTLEDALNAGLTPCKKCAQ